MVDEQDVMKAIGDGRANLTGHGRVGRIRNDGDVISDITDIIKSHQRSDRRVIYTRLEKDRFDIQYKAERDSRRTSLVTRDTNTRVVFFSSLSLFLFIFGFKYLQVINTMSSRQRLNKSTKIVPKIIGLEGRILYFMVVVVVVYGGLCVCMLCVY